MFAFPLFVRNAHKAVPPTFDHLLRLGLLGILLVPEALDLELPQVFKVGRNKVLHNLHRMVNSVVDALRDLLVELGCIRC